MHWKRWLVTTKWRSWYLPCYPITKMPSHFSKVSVSESMIQHLMRLKIPATKFSANYFFRNTHIIHLNWDCILILGVEIYRVFFFFCFQNHFSIQFCNNFHENIRIKRKKNHKIRIHSAFYCRFGVLFRQRFRWNWLHWCLFCSVHWHRAMREWFAPCCIH